MEQKINTWMHKLAAQILTGKALESFNAMDLKSRVSGMAILAHIGGDVQVKAECLRVLPLLN